MLRQKLTRSRWFSNQESVFIHLNINPDLKFRIVRLVFGAFKLYPLESLRQNAFSDFPALEIQPSESFKCKFDRTLSSDLCQHIQSVGRDMCICKSGHACSGAQYV